MTNEPGEELKRVVGIPAFAATIINNTVGVGIYALPALVSLQLGEAGITGYLLCGIVFASIMLCYMEIGSRIKTSGGSYAYVESAFGPFAGFIVNWIFFFGYGVLSSAAVLNIVAGSVSALFPVFASPLMRILSMLVLISLIIYVNIRSARLSVLMVGFITFIKLLPLIGIIIFGIWKVIPSNLHWTHLPSLQSYGDAALTLFFAFAGFETSMCISGEIKNPRRTVPIGIIIGFGSVLILYVLIHSVAQGILGNELSGFKDAPLAEVANRIAGATGAVILLIAAIVSGFGNTCGDVLASPRVLFAGARDGLFPKFLGKVHPRFSTPHWAVITYAGLIFIIAASGGFKQLAILASAALLLIYLAVVLAVIKFRMKPEETMEKSFRIPGGLVIPFMAVIAICWLLSYLSKQEITSMLIFIAVVCVIYLFMKIGKVKSSGQPKSSMPVN